MIYYLINRITVSIVTYQPYLIQSLLLFCLGCSGKNLFPIFKMACFFKTKYQILGWETGQQYFQIMVKVELILKYV